MGKIIPIIPHTIYPTTIPIKIDAVLVTPLVKCFNRIMVTRTTVPTKRLGREPKSPLLFPPPKELIPTEIKESPIAITTVPVTSEGKKRRRGLRKNPNTVSNNPPIKLAKIIAP